MVLICDITLCTTHFKDLDYAGRLNIYLQNALLSIFMVDKVANINLKMESAYLN